MRIKHLTVCYDDKIVIQDMTLTVTLGKLTGIIGPNGAGKSTFLKAMIGIVEKSSGSVLLGDEPLLNWRQKIAYVPQRNEVDLTFPITVFDTVLLGTYPQLGLFKRPGKLARKRAWQALEATKMSEYAKRQIGALSGGQLQRVFIARALAQKAEIFLLDEPFAGIDMTSEALIMTLLKELVKNKKTILVVHHDLHKVSQYFDNIILLNQSLIASGLTSEQFTQQNIKKAFGNFII